MHKMTKATSIPKSVKEAVYERDGGRCILCGRNNGEPVAHEHAMSASGAMKMQQVPSVVVPAGKDLTFAIATSLPFGLNTRQQQAWILQGGGLDLFNDFLSNYNAVMLLGGCCGHASATLPGTPLLPDLRAYTVYNLDIRSRDESNGTTWNTWVLHASLNFSTSGDVTSTARLGFPDFPVLKFPGKREILLENREFPGQNY